MIWPRYTIMLCCTSHPYQQCCQTNQQTLKHGQPMRGGVGASEVATDLWLALLLFQ